MGRRQLKDTRSAFAPTDEVEAGSVNDTGLAASCQVELQGHFEEHEGRVDVMLVQLEHVSQVGEPLLGWRIKRERERERDKSQLSSNA